MKVWRYRDFEHPTRNPLRAKLARPVLGVLDVALALHLELRHASLLTFSFDRTRLWSTNASISQPLSIYPLQPPPPTPSVSVGSDSPTTAPPRGGAVSYVIKNCLRGKTHVQ